MKKIFISIFLAICPGLLALEARKEFYRALQSTIELEASENTKAFAWSPDNKKLAAGTFQLTSKDSKPEFVIWDLETQEGTPLEIPENNGSIYSVAWSPDELRIALGFHSGAILVCNTQNGDGAILFGHKIAVHSLNWTPDSHELYSASFDGTIKHWSIATNNQLREYKHNGLVTCMELSKNGEYLAFGSKDNTIRILDTRHFELFNILSGHTDLVTCVSWAKDSRNLVSGSSDKTVKFWDIRKKEPLTTLEGHTNIVKSVSFSSFGHIASSSEDKTVKIWSTKYGLLRTIKDSSRPIARVAWSPDGNSLALIEELIKVYNIKRLQAARKIKEKNMINSVCWIGQSDFAVAQHDTPIITYNTNNIIRYIKHTKPVNDLSYSPSQNILASGSDDNDILLWSFKHKKILTLKGHTKSIKSLSFSPNGAYLSSAACDDEIFIWDIAKRSVIKKLQSPRVGERPNFAYSISWSPDDRKIAASITNFIFIWDAQTGVLIDSINAHRGAVFSLSWSPDGTRLVSSSQDKTIKIWNVQDASLLHVLTGHSDDVYSVAWSHDGKVIATGSEDGTIKLWNANTYELIQTLKDCDRVYSLAWSPDDKQLLSGSTDKSVIVWQY